MHCFFALLLDLFLFTSCNQLLFSRFVNVFFRDKDGKKLLVFCVFKHIKGQEKMDDMKKFFIYSLERLGREEEGDQITLLFDCRGAGMKNMDMEFVQFIIGTLKDYYPDPLNYILVLEMPWVLNGKNTDIKYYLDILL